MNVPDISTFNGSAAAALAAAMGECQPLLLAAPVYADDRGWSHMNLLQNVLQPQGQINYSVMYPHVIKAWHRHHHQTDFWLCVRGHIKVGVHRESDGRSWQAVIGEKRPAMVIIPPTLWHGMTAIGGASAGLLYYVTKAYDPVKPDEERRAHDSIADFNWEVRHR